MTPEFQVQIADLAGKSWTTVWRGPEAQAREVFLRRLLLHSSGRFRLLDGNGVAVAERQVRPRFSRRSVG